MTHADFGDLPRWLSRGDLLVLNDTRVFPARLLGRRTPSGGAVECLLLQPASDDVWEALVHPGQKLGPGARVEFGDPPAISGEILERRFRGRRLVRLRTVDGRSIMDVVGEIGHMPLPPYIKRADEPSDRDRYQTVYASVSGSVAAPTAGLHVTEELLGNLAAAGVERAALTLHVGYGTFKPVQGERVEDHRVDAESYAVDADAAGAMNRALDEGRRIVAVGTTTTRALETAVQRGGGRVAAAAATSDLFIYPGHAFQAVGALLTNFHLPRSSLLMLVCAFGGTERVLQAYREAVAAGYRFYSYGDAMLVL